MITIIQILIILFAIFAWSRAFLRLKDKTIKINEFIFWSIIWASLIIFSASPVLLSTLSTFVGIQRATDFAVYTSIIILFYLIYRIYAKIEKQEQDITRIVRNISLKRKK